MDNKINNTDQKEELRLYVDQQIDLLKNKSAQEKKAQNMIKIILIMAHYQK